MANFNTRQVMCHSKPKVVLFITLGLLLACNSCKRMPADSWRDVRDGKVYTYIPKENLNWMTCNLNYLEKSVYCNGAWVFSYDEKEYEDALIKINNSNSGVLYNWNTAQSVTTDGWRLPSVREWQSLLNQEPEVMESSLGDYNLIRDGRARMYEKFCIYSGSTFWTSDQSEDGNSATVVIIDFNSDGTLEIRYEEQSKNHSFYLRCVKERKSDRNNTQL